MGRRLIEAAIAACPAERCGDPGAESLAAAPGVGAMAKMALASGLPMPGANRRVKVAMKVGKYSQSVDRNSLCALALRHMSRPDERGPTR